MVVHAGRDLLLECLRVEDPQTQSDRINTFSQGDWRALADTARAHDLSAYLLQHLSELPTRPTLDDKAEQALRQSSQKISALSLHLHSKLGEILHAFHHRNIPVIVLKGAYMAEAVYKNIALRSMADIDLLVPEDQLEPCDRLLLDLGYGPTRKPWIERDYRRVHHHLPIYAKPNSPPIELHWTIAKPTFPFSIDVEDLWRRSRPTQIAGAPARVLSPVDMLLHLCLHACTERFRDKLRGLVDLLEFTRRCKDELDWDLLSARTVEWKTEKCTFLYLYLGTELLNAPVPQATLRALEPPDLDPGLMEDAIEKVWGEPHISYNFARLWGQANFGQKARLVWDRVFLSQDELSSKYDLQPSSPRVIYYYLVRLKDLLQRYIPLVRQKRSTQEKSREIRSLDHDTALVDWLFSD